MGSRACQTVGPLKWITRYQFTTLLGCLAPNLKAAPYFETLANPMKLFKSTGIWVDPMVTFHGTRHAFYILETVWEKYKDYPGVDEEQNPHGH